LILSRGLEHNPANYRKEASIVTTMFVRSGTVLALALGVLLSGSPAQADAIDGNWCYKDGRRMSIDGDDIITPGGTRLIGKYERHSFSYTVPPSEPGAGQEVSMNQEDEETIHVRVGKGPEKTWRRCGPVTS